MESVLYSVVLLLGGLLMVECRDYTYINTGKGHDGSQCINGGTEHPCQTLKYVADYVSNHTTVLSLNIKIQDPSLHVNQTLNFTRVVGLTLEGQPTEFVCNCRHDASCGLKFYNSQNLVIKNLTLIGCRVDDGPGAALSIHNCSDVILEENSFKASLESGLSIIDTHGVVLISNSVFEGSGACTRCKSSSGLTVIFNIASGIKGNYTIEKCNFSRNNMDQMYGDSTFGGGIKLRFRGASAANTVYLKDVTFEENHATWGGGMSVQFSKNATSNSLTIWHAIFRKNNAARAGGGIDIGYIDCTSNTPITNHVHIENSEFEGNSARYGGGTAIYSSPTTCAHDADNTHNALVLKSCTWRENSALFSSTVDISPFSYSTLGRYYFPHPKFIDCNFTSSRERKGRNNNYTFINVGSFAVYGYEVQFEGTVRFQNLSFTALHVTDGTVSFLSGTQACFENNTGSQGGALAFFGGSVLNLYPNSTLMFKKNSAFVGGAIYHSTHNHHDLISSRTCFIQNNSKNDFDQKPRLVFRQNKAGREDQAGQSIFATTFLPCYFEQLNNSFYPDKVLDALQQIASFDFGNESEKTALGTSGYRFHKLTPPPYTIPGQGVDIPLNMIDELGNNATTVYRVMLDKDSVCKTDRQYMIDRLVVNAPESTPCNLSLVSDTFRESQFKLRLEVEKCPPGFHISTNPTCVCSAYSKEYAYYGINTCHDQQSVAFLRNGFWAGYDRDNESLLTARCPSSFCVTHRDQGLHGIELPNTASSEKLEGAICHPHRIGWLCGQCDSNHTTYYHSPTYRCSPHHLCAWGVLFYFISEVLPIVVMFSVIAIFDIRFTTGTASGLVFFAQIIDTVTLGFKWNSKLPDFIEILSIGYKVIYGLFNLDFFNLDLASFCLWKDANVLDVIAFKYVSVVFAFALLLSIVLFLKYCTLKCLQTESTLLPLGKNKSVIHSMSAVLVMCYAQCTNISLQILATTTLRGAGREVRHHVTLFGGVDYFQKEHLQYAVAACLCMFTVVALPPLLLLVYPGTITILSFFKLGETRPSQFLSRGFIQLKPFLDSFQGCYKDSLRFFSSFFFLSRVVILAINAFVSSTSQSIIDVEIVVLILLGMYALFQPFHRAVDNTNTTLILLNMSLIGGFTMLAYSQSGFSDQQHIVTLAMVVRLILLYLPIVCTCVYMVMKVISWHKKRMADKRKSYKPGSVTEEEESSRVIDHSYLPFQEVAVACSIPAPDDGENELSGSYSDREDLLGYI